MALRAAITHGLRGLLGNEMLYRLRMRAEHHAGNIAGVKAAYDELALYLADFEAQPSAETTATLEELLERVASSSSAWLATAGW